MMFTPNIIVRSAAVLICCVVLVSSLGIDTAVGARELQKYKEEFVEYKKVFNRNYASPKEEKAAYEVFKANMVKNKLASEKNPYAKFGMTEFTDRSPKTLSKSMLGLGPMMKSMLSASTHKTRYFFEKNEIESPTVVDHRKTGVDDASVVRNTVQCPAGSFASAAADAVAGTWTMLDPTAKPAERRIGVSPQQFLQCAAKKCNPADELSGKAMTSGWVGTDSFSYLRAEKHYPAKFDDKGHTDKQIQCSASPSLDECPLGEKCLSGTVTAAHYLPEDEGEMMAWVAKKGPLVVGVDASSWANYKGGVLSACKGDNIPNHFAVIVGYVRDAFVPYWIVKNSWGADWGEKGYVRIQQGANICGITKLSIGYEVAEAETKWEL